MKSQYAAGILSIVSLASSKISYVMFVRSITVVPLDRKIAQVFIILLSVWGLVSVITVAFQCQPLPTWDYLAGKCYDRVSFSLNLNVQCYYYYEETIESALLMIALANMAKFLWHI